MVGTRWVRRVGPGLAALGAVAIVATSTLGARDRPWDPPPCQETAQEVGPRVGRGGGWIPVSRVAVWSASDWPSLARDPVGRT